MYCQLCVHDKGVYLFLWDLNGMQKQCSLSISVWVEVTNETDCCKVLHNLCGNVCISDCVFERVIELWKDFAG